MKQYKLSSFQYYKEVIKGNGKTQHMNIKLYSSDTELIDLSQAVITASSVPVSGNLESLLDPNNTVPVVFRDNEIVMINVDVKKVVNLHHITVKHLTSGSLADNNIKLSIDKEDWFTVYDMRESGLFDESKSLSIKTNYWFNTDPQSGMILDVEDISFFDPKLMIWDNDLKVQNFIKLLLSKSQYYKMHTDSTNNLVHLVNDEELYPERYMDNMMVNWIQLGSVSGVEQIKIKIGSLGEVNAKFPGNNGSFSLDGGKPYLGVYNAKSNTFLIVSGGAGGASSEISLYQPNSGFKTFDLAHYDGELKKFVVPELLSRTPKMVDVILEVQGDWLKGTNSGKVKLVGMTDSAGAQLKLGECYVADPKNPKKITAMEPSEGLVQPILQTFEENGELIGILMEGPSYYTGDGAGLTAFGKGLSQNDGVLEVETVDDINLSNPSPNKIPSELAVSKIKGIIIDTIADLVKTNLKEGEVVEVLGYYTAGDGAGHKRIIANEDDESGVQLANNLWANIIHNGEVNVSWFGAKGDRVTDDSSSIQKAMNYKANIFAQGNFLINNTIEINDRDNLNINFENTTFKYTGTGYAFKLYKTRYCTFRFGRIYSDNGGGIELYSDGGTEGIYNFIQYLDIYFNEFSVKNTCFNFNMNGSWITETRFYNGQVKGNIGFYADSKNKDSINGIKLHNIGFEGVNTGVWLKDGCQCWSILMPRYAEAIEPLLIKTEGSVFGLIFIGQNLFYHKYVSFSDKTFGKIISPMSNHGGSTEAYEAVIRDGVILYTNHSNSYMNMLSKEMLDLNNAELYDSSPVTYFLAGDNVSEIKNQTIKLSNKYGVQHGTNEFYVKTQYNHNESTLKILDYKGNIVFHRNNIGYVFLKFRYHTGVGGTEKWICEKIQELKDIEIAENLINTEKLNSIYMLEKMKQENVYNDYIAYMDEKIAYDKQQKQLEEQRMLSYKEALKENPNLTYEEFISVQPMTLNLVEEPQPSQALKDFMEKYL